MELDTRACYEALRSRDPRFDGRFFTGVLTTGIYCRPICPAVTPRFENVRFFACAAAAEENGFRPCKRCRPETAPGTPPWAGTSTTVKRALRLIAEGGLDDGGVDVLAAKLGIGARHLRRLFHEELGASPLSVAETHRIHFARKLLDSTDWPVGRLALLSGFGSVRRFNDAIRNTFGLPPTRLRRMSEGVGPTKSPRLRIPYVPPYDWDALLDWFEVRAVPGLELVRDGAYRRTFELAGARGILEVRHDPRSKCLEVLLPAQVTASLIPLAEKVRRQFDCSSVPQQIATHLRRDPLLAPLVSRRPGLRVPGAFCPFELAVRAILGQQVSVRGARTFAERLVQIFGDPMPGDTAGLTHVFPDPSRLMQADLSRIGITRARASTIRAVAAAFCDGRIDLSQNTELDGFVGRLAAIPGVGPWTAHYIAMRGAGEPDAFPSGDLWLRRAASTTTNPLKSRELESRSAAWRPWRAYAAMHLWLKTEVRK
ncbi:MAG: DNA-3-methyladenine glycosylase 2 family protein [Acidobacteria bacterium]|nr:DNA-3-methyladenine glycosylase 2 family protein [Acidobacteriota bacterium]